MEEFSKILEFIGKYAWAVFFTTCFLLFVPDDAATQIGLLELRKSFRGILWIVLVFTFVLSLGTAFQYLHKEIIEGYLKQHHNRKKQKEQIEMLALRLNSLNLNEKMWIKYCLFHNTQTLSAEQINVTAQSLSHKGIVVANSGSILDLPFHIPDHVWLYMLEHKDELLPKEERDDQRFPEALKNFRKSLWGNF